MTIAAMIKDNVVVNVVMAAEDPDFVYPGDHDLSVIVTDETGPAGIGYTYENGTFTAPPPPPPAPVEPIKMSKIDFRRLLTPQEAAFYRLLEHAPRITGAELQTAFDPATEPAEAIELQVRIAVEDAIQQFNLLSDTIEVDHPDTAEFLGVMGMAGMFADTTARIAQITAGQPPA